MSEAQPLHHVVQVWRHHALIHVQEVASYDEALALQARFQRVPHSETEIIKVHDQAATDLAGLTREIVESMAAQAPN